MFNYQEVQAKWFQTPDLFKSHIEVLDKKTNKSKGGFKEDNIYISSTTEGVVRCP